MKVSHIGIITIILVITAIVFAGCTSSAPSSSTTTPQVTATVTTTTGTSAVTTTPPPVTTGLVKVTESPVKVFNGDYHWVEYRNNISVTMPPNPRYQRDMQERVERSSETYKGTPAVHYKSTETSDYPEWVGDTLTNTKNGHIFVDDSYYDTSTNKFLGETTTEMIKGVLTPAVDSSAYYAVHYREDKPGGWMGITPFGEMNISLTYNGTESLTVPAGTYPNTKKYTGKFGDGTPITFWVAPGIPVPVQYQFPNKYLDGENPFQSYELNGWG